MVKKPYFVAITVCCNDIQKTKDAFCLCVYIYFFNFDNTNLSENQMKSCKGKYFENEKKQYNFNIR